MTSKTTNALKS